MYAAQHALTGCIGIVTVVVRRRRKVLKKLTLICEAMPGLAMTSFKECLYAEDAPANSTFCLFNIKGLQRQRELVKCTFPLSSLQRHQNVVRRCGMGIPERDYTLEPANKSDRVCAV